MKDKQESENVLSCKQCCEEIPYSPESVDYVVNFCGIDCYHKWRENPSQMAKPENYVQKPHVQNPDQGGQARQ